MDGGDGGATPVLLSWKARAAAEKAVISCKETNHSLKTSAVLVFVEHL
jgi:hypothetical protein